MDRVFGHSVHRQNISLASNLSKTHSFHKQYKSALRGPTLISSQSVGVGVNKSRYLYGIGTYWHLHF